MSDPRFWSYTSQKEWFVIFGGRVAKMGQNPGGKFWDLWRKGPKSLQVRILNIWPMIALQKDEPKFWPGESISLRNFTPVVPKVSVQDFLSILGAPLPKITNRSVWPLCDQMVPRCFWPACDQNLGSLLLMCENGSNFWNFNWRDFGPLRQWSKSFPPGFFTHFGRPTAENYESVHGPLTLKILGNLILSVYYRYLIQGMIHLESLHIKFCLFKKTSNWHVK